MARLEAFRAEQESIRQARPAPPPLESVVPKGANILRLRGAAGTVEVSADSATGAPEGDAAESYDSEDAPWPTEPVGAVEDGDGPAAAPARVAAAERTATPTKTGPLPPLDDLRRRLMPSEAEALEDLFRAKIVSVKRIQAGWLKP